MKKLFIFIICILLIHSPTVYSEIQTITVTESYSMGDGESKTSAQNHVLEKAQRTATEKVGVYVESYSKVANYVLQKDEIITISASIIKVVNKEFKWEKTNNDEFYVTCNLTVNIDDSNLDELIKHGIQNRKQAEENEQLKEQNKNLAKEAENAKREAEETKKQTETIINNPNIDANNIATAKLVKEGDDNLSKGNWRDAIKKYRQALEIDKDCIGALMGMGNVNIQLNHNNEAIGYFDKVLSLKQNYSEAWMGKGTANNNMHNPSEAIKCYQKAWDYGCTNPYLQVNMGMTYMAMHEPQKAYPYLQEAIRKHKTAYNYCQLGIYYATLGQDKNALECYNQAIQIDSNYGRTYFRLGELYYKHNMREEARQSYQTFINLSKNSPQEQNNISIAITALRNL